MSFQPTPKQTLILWRLLTTDGKDFLKNIKPELKPADRKPLVTEGLIAEEKRKDPAVTKGARPIFFICLSEKGWQWAAANLDAEMSGSPDPTSKVFRGMMKKVKAYLDRNNIPLATFICSSPASAAPADDGSELSQKIRSAYLALSGGQLTERVRLAALRRQLAEVPRDALDVELERMEVQGVLRIIPLDSPQEVRADDQEAALPNSAGNPRHVVYLTR